MVKICMHVRGVLMRYYFTTRDLVTIAILSSLGGALSAYIGYLGNMVNKALGVPFGAGQFMAGLHILWIILALGITAKKGAGVLTGTLKGLVELFLGSTHGIVVVVISCLEGLVADLVLFSDKIKEKREPVMYSIAGGVSSAANILVFQAIYFSNVPVFLLIIMYMLACGSGIIFGGVLGIQILEALEHAGVVARVRRVSKRTFSRAAVVSIAVSGIFLVSFTIGAIYYFSSVYYMNKEDGVRIEGNVEKPYLFLYDDFKENETKIIAELNGSFTHEPAKEYKGVPLRLILTKAKPSESAKEVTVKGKDGYSAKFVFSEVMNDDEMIIVKDGENYRLVASKYDGSKWVREICVISHRMVEIWRI
ncbi:MAG: ECF transporter S component [Thermoplasmata archaeon]